MRRRGTPASREDQCPTLVGGYALGPGDRAGLPGLPNRNFSHRE